MGCDGAGAEALARLGGGEAGEAPAVEREAEKRRLRAWNIPELKQTPKKEQSGPQVTFITDGLETWVGVGR